MDCLYKCIFNDDCDLEEFLYKKHPIYDKYGSNHFGLVINLKTKILVKGFQIEENGIEYINIHYSYKKDILYPIHVFI